MELTREERERYVEAQRKWMMNLACQQTLLPKLMHAINGAVAAAYTSEHQKHCPGHSLEEMRETAEDLNRRMMEYKGFVITLVDALAEMDEAQKTLSKLQAKVAPEEHARMSEQLKRRVH